VLPGGPARAALGKKATPVAIAQFDKENGYDKPVVSQLLIWFNNLLHGKLGFSYVLNEPVATAIGQALPKSILLSGLATILALLIAIPMGVLQAIRKNKVEDHALTTLAFVAYSTPTFFLGLVLITIFAVQLRWLPSEAPQSASVLAILLDPAGLILPVLTLAAAIAASFSRYIRSSMLDVLVEDFIQTARAKGLVERMVMFRHALPNALASTVTLLGLTIPVILSGSVVTEQLFNYQGMGLLFWEQAQSYDFPTVLGICLIVALATVVGNLLADLSYAILDPRIRATV
jgi:peptide/nickel transport system permease protein